MKQPKKHIEVEPPIRSKDNILEIHPDVMLALDKYADAERERMENPEIKKLITGKSLAQHILKNEVEKRGYYERGFAK